MRISKVLLSVLVVVASALLLSGCGATPSRVMAGDSSACPPAEPAHTDRNIPVVAVLAAVGSQSPAVASAMSSARETVLAGAESMQAHFLLNGVGDGVDAPNMLANLRLVGEGPNPLMRDADLCHKVRVIREQYGGLTSGRRPTAPDLISALVTLKDDLQTFPHGAVHVVVLGPSTDRTKIEGARAFDLMESTALANPTAAINVLARAGLNFDCTGWRVSIVGGSAGSDGRPVSPAIDSQLKRFWLTYLRHCHGALVAYGSRLATFPVTGGPIEDADRRMIPIKIVRKARVIEATVLSKVLFATGSAKLRAGAARGLSRLLPMIARSRGRVEVTGHTDNSGTDAINVPLSEARARSVALWLAQHDVARHRLSSVGRGSSEPVEPNSTATGRARNRRVVIGIYER